MKHFSHPHALKLFELAKNDDDDEIFCSACDQAIFSSPKEAYTCTKCDCNFILDKSCYELPRKTEHKSHPDHPLVLLSEPPRFKFYYDCNACGGLITCFSFHCDDCDDFRLHVNCASLPESFECKAHPQHLLSLEYTTPKLADDDFSIILCDVCDGGLTEGRWCYYCKECEFSTHLECAFSAEGPKEEEEEEENEEEDKEGENGEEETEEESDQMKLFRANIRAMNQMAINNFQLQMAEINARAIRRM